MICKIKKSKYLFRNNISNYSLSDVKNTPQQALINQKISRNQAESERKRVTAPRLHDTKLLLVLSINFVLFNFPFFFTKIILLLINNRLKANNVDELKVQLIIKCF